MARDSNSREKIDTCRSVGRSIDGFDGGIHPSCVAAVVDTSERCAIYGDKRRSHAGNAGRFASVFITQPLARRRPNDFTIVMSLDRTKEGRPELERACNACARGHSSTQFSLHKSYIDGINAVQHRQMLQMRSCDVTVLYLHLHLQQGKGVRPAHRWTLSKANSGPPHVLWPWPICSFRFKTIDIPGVPPVKCILNLSAERHTHKIITKYKTCVAA